MTIDICADIVKRQDYGRYLTVLFAPRRLQKFLWILYALNCELINVRQNVAKEKMMGLIRLQWWRDAIAELYAGQILNHHVLHGFADVIKETPFWQQQDFDALFSAYEEDFRHDDTGAQNKVDRRIRQNKIVLLLALRIYDVSVDENTLHIIATHYTKAKAILQNEWQPDSLPDFVAHALLELDLVPRQTIRGLSPLLMADIARYDYTAIRKANYQPLHLRPEIYRSLIGFYLWRRNPFFNMAFL